MSEPSIPPPQSAAKPAAPPAARRAKNARLWPAIQLSLAVVFALAAAVWLVWPEGHGDDEAEPPEQQVVKLIGQHRLAIVPDTLLEQKLKVTAVNRQRTSTPMLKVTGSVVARLAHSASQDAKVEGRWDFSAPELASAYADWLKARNDVPFNETQRINIFKLAEATVAAKREVAERLEKLVNAGTDPVKDLVAAKADLLQSQIQGEKDKHEAQTNVDNAKRTLATLERQLFQAGIDPALLAQNTSTMAIVVAEIPEAQVGLARQGDPCTAEFYGYPGKLFDGTVGSVSPTISKERRTLRVFFQVNDPRGTLRPGMYADVGLSTNAREMLLIPADGVLHVGQFDYVLVADGENQWKVVQVKTGEQFASFLEILSGLQPGDRVIGAGAILLKPYVVADIQSAADSAVTGGAAAQRVGESGGAKPSGDPEYEVPRGR